MHTSCHVHVFLFICLFIKNSHNIKGATRQTWQLEFSKLMLILTAVKVLVSAPDGYVLSNVTHSPLLYSK